MTGAKRQDNEQTIVQTFAQEVEPVVPSSETTGTSVGHQSRLIETRRISDVVDQELLGRLGSIVGPDNVLSDFDARLKYARDNLPFAKYAMRSGQVPASVPQLIVRPANTSEVAAVVILSQTRGFQIIPVGGSSGVLGGAVPLSRELVLDLTRLDRILDLNTTDGTVRVQAGMFGGKFEEELNAFGWTCGHFPQSMLISTVGGWAACRGGGQASSRYGKIEDIVTGMEVVMPSGKALRIRPLPRRSVGPSIKDIFIGSEGTLGVITEMTLRIWRRPETEVGLVCAFPSLEDGLLASREIMQSEIRPEILRIYDAAETAHRADGDETYLANPIMGFFAFCGPKPLVQTESELALAIIRSHGGVVGSDTPFRQWRSSRYVSLSEGWTREGYFNDTIEVTIPWSKVLELYGEILKKVAGVHADLFFGSHWSHAYPDGVCQYMTFRLPPMPDAAALPLHAKIWEIVMETTLIHGGSISHHHGIGVFRNRWMEKEHGEALNLIQQIKDALDPQNLMNPGKLGLRPAAGATELGIE